MLFSLTRPRLLLPLNSSKSCLFIFNFPCTLTQSLSSQSQILPNGIAYFLQPGSELSNLHLQSARGGAGAEYGSHDPNSYSLGNYRAAAFSTTLAGHWECSRCGMHIAKLSLVLTFFFSHHWQVSQIILDLMNPFQKNFILSFFFFLPSPAGQKYRLKTLSCCSYRKKAEMHLAKEVTPGHLLGFPNPSQSMEAQTQAVFLVGHGHPQRQLFMSSRSKDSSGILLSLKPHIRRVGSQTILAAVYWVHLLRHLTLGPQFPQP